MLLIVRKDERREILAKWDAWYINATAEAEKFIEDNNLEVIEREITFMGNMVIWVK